MERCRTIPEVYGFEVVLKQAIPLLPESLKDQRERFGGISLASGALESWWIRLELNPVAPAILRIE
jgi:hypothetical protein